MALVFDSGPLYASLDRRDSAHLACRRLIENAQERLIVPAPVMVEMDYLITTRLHVGIMLQLLRDIDDGAFDVLELEKNDYRRILELCDQYSDSDIGFVDAAVLAVVERLGETKVVTLDHRHFRMLRPRHVDALQLLPE